MKTLFRKTALVLSMMLIVAFASPLCLCASDLNGVGSSATDGGSSNANSDDSALSDYMRSYTPITQENMQRANTLASPIANALGTLTGAIMVVVGAGIFFVTACDLLYIGLPFTRSLLNPQPAGGAGGGMPMGGMGMGGMGGMGMSGGSQPAQEYGLRRKWVSDEAIAAVALGQGGAAQGGGMGMSGGMGMGMSGGMGGMGMMGGGMGGQQQQMPTKSIIFEYLKKRMFFLIVFAIASIVLMSSVLTDCGINLAELLLRILEKFNGSIANVQVQ